MNSANVYHDFNGIKSESQRQFCYFWWEKIEIWLHILFFFFFVDEIPNETHKLNENVSRWCRNMDPRLTTSLPKKNFIIIYRENWVWTVSFSFSYYNKLKYFDKFQFQFFLEAGKADMAKYDAIKIDFPLCSELRRMQISINSENDYNFFVFYSRVVK